MEITNFNVPACFWEAYFNLVVDCVKESSNESGLKDFNLLNVKSEIKTFRFAYNEEPFQSVGCLDSSFDLIVKGKVLVVSMSACRESMPFSDYFFTTPHLIRNALSQAKDNTKYVDVCGNKVCNTFDTNSKACFSKAFLNAILSRIESINPDFRLNDTDWRKWDFKSCSS